MSVATHAIVKEWKEFSISLPLLEAAIKLVAGPNYCGNSAGVNLVLHFTAEPTVDEVAAIDALWDAIDDQHEIATGYVNQATIAADVAAKKASGKAKLLALGLNEQEIAALVG